MLSAGPFFWFGCYERYNQAVKPLVLFCMLALCAMSIAQTPRERKLLDFGWRFHLGSAGDMAKDFGFGGGQTFAKAGEGPGPIRPPFNDASWREVNLPHDWVVEEDFVHDDDGLYVQHGSKPTGRKFPDNAVGWYRRTFDIPSSDRGRRLSVEFNGVFRDSLVWLNGHLLGRHQSGYSSFAYDMTDFVNYGGKNVLTVRCDASQYEGWFYEGAGIYRHVWLVKTNPVHVARYGTYITTDAFEGEAEVVIRTRVQNDGDQWKAVAVQIKGLPDGEQYDAPLKLEAWSSNEGTIRFRILRPILWSLENPYVYAAKVVVTDGKEMLDEYPISFGIRTLHFDKDKGFFLNGKRVEIKGTCNHQDHAGIGAALPDRMQYFRIEQLKKMGCNAIRTSHNPPTPELLDACDRLGMLVMDENRLLDSSEQGLHDLETLVKRDRNHPSVILWSIGNEEPEQGTPIGAQIATTMARHVHDLDPTRPVTYAGNNGTEYEGVNSVVDVRGMNYITLGSPDEYHKAHPEQPMFGSEEASTLSTRGEYKNDPDRGYMAAYDVNKPGWGALAEEWWSYYAQRPWLAGAFVWTGFDYRGEPTPYGWPCISSHFGILDTCGFPKDNFYYYQSWWTDEPVLHIFPHWNWAGHEGQPIDVWCFSNAQEVELLLNGKSLGKKAMPLNGHLSWSVLYKSGVLEARGYRDGKVVQTSKVETTGKADHIVLTPDREVIDADGEDVCVFTVEVVDKEGRVVPDASNDILFEVDGGTILGVGNGDPSSHERDRFVDSAINEPITGWTRYFTNANGTKQSASVPVDVNGEASGMPAHTFATYEASFDMTPEMRRGRPMLNVGQIDDFGEIRVNGDLVGNTKDWDASYAFPLSAQVGTNKLTITVQNNDGPGGLGRGVSISYTKPGERWHRSVFHGLAQIIVQGRTEPSRIRLTATSNGLKPASVDIIAKEAPYRGLTEDNKRK